MISPHIQLHIKSFIISFHLLIRFAQNVDKALLSLMIEIQSDVRDFFQWELEGDLQSATDMANNFSNNIPYGLEKWRERSRSEALADLQERLLNATEVVIIGASVSPSDIKRKSADGTIFIAADGSIGSVDSYSDVACVVTDFDGNPHLDKAASSGVLFIAHAHGDNVSRWHQTIARWSKFTTPPSLILSHQTPQVIAGMHNFGGFTDGDRALCLALFLGVKREAISLIGFSTQSIGEFSGQTNSDTKLVKLKWMKQIVETLGFGEFIKD